MLSRQKAFLFLVNDIDKSDKSEIRSIMEFLKSDSGMEYTKKFDEIDYLSLKRILNNEFARWLQGGRKCLK